MNNICHFVFGLKKQSEEFLFIYYIAVYSAYLINNPDTIYFYYHYEPYGTWYDTLKLIPNLKLVKIDIPTHIGNKEIKKTAHKADWVRINMLYNKGGVYLDIDTICVKPWKHLFNEDVVLGKEVPNGICNAIMFTKPKSDFFKFWLDKYERHFNPNGWREASIVLPEKLSKEYPNLVTLKEPDVFFLPNYNETQKIFVDTKQIPKNLISLHLWETYSMQYMKKINDWSWAYENSHTMYGKMLLNLIDNYIMSDSNYYFAHKNHFKKKRGELICTVSTFLKKSLKNSRELEEHMKIKFEIGSKVNIVNDFNDTYYLVSYLPKLHIIHRIDKTNTGDMVSNCSEYYSFENYQIIKHDIYSPDFASIKKNDPIILSGGGLLNCLENWNKNINKLLELSENVFGWGIGFNKHHNNHIKTKINLSKFKLLGIRDYKQSYESNTRYLPCSSCNLPQLKYEYKIQRNIGIIEHHHNKIILKEKYDKINNELNIDDIIKFIGESNIIITNTYHALYFSALLNKKCILYNSFSEKFNHTKFHYINYKNNMELNENNNMLNETQTLNKELLQNSIKINDIFYSDIISKIN